MPFGARVAAATVFAVVVGLGIVGFRMLEPSRARARRQARDERLMLRLAAHNAVPVGVATERLARGATHAFVRGRADIAPDGSLTIADPSGLAIVPGRAARAVYAGGLEDPLRAEHVASGDEVVAVGPARLATERERTGVQTYRGAQHAIVLDGSSDDRVLLLVQARRASAPG